MLKKNKTFIFEKPEHVTAITLWFPDQKSMEDLDVLYSIDLLKKNFDIYLVFSENLQFFYDLEKYARLCQAKGYTISSDMDQCQATWWTLKYLRKFASSYIGYYGMEADKMERVPADINEFVRVSQCPLNIGIIHYSRMPYSEIINLSKKPDSMNFFRFIKTGGIDARGLYCTHKALSDTFYIRPWIIDKIKEFMNGNAEYTQTPGHLFLDSFRGFRFADFLVSWAEKTLEPNKHVLNVKLKNAKA